MSRPRRIATAAAALSAVLAAVLAVPAAAQLAYPPAPEQSQSVSETLLEPGQSLTVSATGFDTGSTVDVVLRSVETRLGSTTIDGQGRFALRVTVPCGTEPGPHHVVSIGQDPSLVPFELSSPVTVVDQPCRPLSLEPGPGGGAGAAVAGDVPAGDDLPSTGTSLTLPLVVLAVALLAAGGTAAVLGARRRSSR